MKSRQRYQCKHLHSASDMFTTHDSPDRLFTKPGVNFRFDMYRSSRCASAGLRRGAEGRGDRQGTSTFFGFFLKKRRPRFVLFFYISFLIQEVIAR